MTQQELAAAIEVPQATIARIEAGTVLPRTATLMALLRATGHELDVVPVGPVVERESVLPRLRSPVSKRARQALGKHGTDRPTSPIRTVVRLRWFGVPFVLIGDLAEVVRGRSGRLEPTVEICVADTDDARARLERAREDLGDLAGDRRLRVVTSTAAGDDHAMLSVNAALMFVDAGITAPVASVHDLIRARRARGTPSDLQIAAELTAIRDAGVR